MTIFFQRYPINTDLFICSFLSLCKHFFHIQTLILWEIIRLITQGDQRSSDYPVGMNILIKYAIYLGNTIITECCIWSKFVLNLVSLTICLWI